ncbi:MAG TPA: hypothetical protein VKP02_09585, partial [Gemmatimonadaceae bacterium]|nr:hypothetical protein [Gemmatimonadaceae bacterium]
GHSVFAETQDSHFYHSGEHRDIAVGSGRGPAFVSHSSDVTEEGECETVIAGRRVTITKYRWVNEDALLSASGNAGSQFMVVARFYAEAALREVFVAFSSNAPSDFNYYRGLFWTVTFSGPPGSQSASATPATLVTDDAGPPAAAPLPNATPASAAPAPVPSAACAATPGLPTPDAVLDSSVVRMLIAGAAPIPKGYEVMALQFAATGDLSGMSVAQSDLPEAAQHELSAVIATNLKAHDAHAPPAFLLRIDSGDTGLRYAVLPISGWSH